MSAFTRFGILFILALAFGPDAWGAGRLPSTSIAIINMDERLFETLYDPDAHAIRYTYVTKRVRARDNAEIRCFTVCNVRFNHQGQLREYQLRGGNKYVYDPRQSPFFYSL